MKGKINILSSVKKINYLTPPSHIVLVSTISKNGIRNVAPFGMFMIASSKPPMVAIGVSPKSDTYRNIVDTKEFVVGIPRYECLDKLYKAGDKLPPEKDEFQYSGLTPYNSNSIAPAKIVECCVNIECKLNWLKESGNHYLICGDVIDADINKELITFVEDSIKLRTSLDCAYHITSSNFAVGFCEIKDVK